MKTLFLAAVLVLFCSTGTAKLTGVSRPLSPLNARKLHEMTSICFGEDCSSSEEAQSCVVPPNMDYTYSRTGTPFETVYKLLVTQCLARCLRSIKPTCVAINYNPFIQECILLKTSGTMSASNDYMTALVRFADESICNPANFLPGINRPTGKSYRVTPPGQIKLAEYCCQLCEQDSPRCASWVYSIGDEVCYLISFIPLPVSTENPGKIMSGFGAYCSASVA